MATARPSPAPRPARNAAVTTPPPPPPPPGDGSTGNDDKTPVPAAAVVTKAPSPVASFNVLSGAEQLYGSTVRVGVSVQVTDSLGRTSVLMVPDAGTVKDGTSPVYLTKPIVLAGEKLHTYLTNPNRKGGAIPLPKEVDGLLKNTTATIRAFYFTTTGPLLAAFTVENDKGLIASLTNDEALGELFDITGVALRIFRSADEKEFAVLKKYVEELDG